MVKSDVSRQALALPVSERFALMRELQDSLTVEGHVFDPHWLAKELERRRVEDEWYPDEAVLIDAMRVQLSIKHGWDAGR